MLRVALVLACVVFGLVSCKSYVGYPQSGGYCTGGYPYESYCSGSAGSTYACFDNTVARCCGCTGGVCYGCKSSIYCPSKLGGKCKTSLMPTWALAMTIGMPLGILALTGGILACAFCCGSSSTNSQYSVTYSTATASNVSVSLPVASSSPPAYYGDGAPGMTEMEPMETEMEPVAPPVHNVYAPAVVPAAPAYVSPAYGGAGAGGVVTYTSHAYGHDAQGYTH